MIAKLFRSCWRVVVSLATRVAATVVALFVFDISKSAYRAMKRQAFAAA